MINKKGYIDHIVFRNESNGYTVFWLVCEKEDVQCVGIMDSISPGETIEVSGEMTIHPTYGEQLKIEHYNPVAPDDPESLKRYLGSGAISGVGEKLAERIIKAFGEDTMHVLECEPERLAEVKGISDRKAREIAIQFSEKRDARAAFMFLQEFGISNTMAVRIYDEYGAAIYSIMKENPYKLAEDIRGIGFKMADEIATKAGIRVDSQFRIKSGIMYVLSESISEGHMYLPMGILLEKTSLLLDLPADGIRVEIDNLAMERRLIIKLPEEESDTPEGQPQVYVYSFYYAELSCAAMLHDLNLTNFECRSLVEKETLERKLAAIETKLQMDFDEIQRQAVFSAVTSGIFILSGGPGTGKTTTINAMISYFVDEGMDFMLAAPTGRAAKRMTEATGYEAKTIHRLLELNGSPDEERSRARFEKNEDNPLEADVIIVDEMSMVDIFLFQALLKAIMPGTRLILVGDVDQLPSVGAGQVLKDVMESGAFNVITLTKVFRQSADSDIIMNAHAIRNGKYPVLNNKSSDFFFLPRNDSMVIYKHMVELITEKLSKFYKVNPYEIQVLTPMKKGMLGVEALNSMLQQYINPPSDSKREHETSGTLIREGDKVMQIKNNYQLEWEVVGHHNIVIDKGTGVFNGDMGTVREINDYAKTLSVEYDDNRCVTYPFSQLDEIELAYAITIHKSQGSEYPVVVMPLLSGPRSLFNRNLLYTAITRAKKCAVILGSEETIKEMVDNDYINKRYTGLKDRIIEVCI